MGVAAFGLAWLLISALPTFSAESIKPAMKKWRPKDGVYAGATNFKGNGRDSPVDAMWPGAIMLIPAR